MHPHAAVGADHVEDVNDLPVHPRAHRHPEPRRAQPGCARIPAKHWGEEIIYVLEGELEYSIDGLAPKTYSAGEALMVPAETVHSVRNVGRSNAAELATYVVEKGKPFIVLAE